MVLSMLLEDFLLAGFPLTLALDHDAQAQARWREQLAPRLNDVKIIPIRDLRPGRTRVSAASVAETLGDSGASEVFMGALDEVGSGCLRRAALGWTPPAPLRGRWSGIYHRPRFLTRDRSPNNWLKRLGFLRLSRQGWFRHVFVFDEFLCGAAQPVWPSAPLHTLSLPCHNTFAFPPTEARRRLNIPPDRKVFLFYGGGYRRKGLHLVLEAMLGMAPNLPAFLLCAGQQPPVKVVLQRLADLSASSRALVLNRYVSTEEEELCYCASDVVLLPYIGHFGTSAVMAQAVHAGKPMIASDEQLLGRRVREHGLGWLFPSGDAKALQQSLTTATLATAQQMQVLQAAVARYAATCTRECFRQSLLGAYGAGAPQPPGS